MYRLRQMVCGDQMCLIIFEVQMIYFLSYRSMVIENITTLVVEIVMIS